MKNLSYAGLKRIPNILKEFKISLSGEIVDSNGNVISLTDFNRIVNTNINDLAVLVSIVYQGFKWPSVYWSEVKALRTVEGCDNVESIKLGLTAPVESKEFPGFFMIPYFSNYVISACGMLIKKSTGEEIKASRNPLGYYTFRMSDDLGGTQNRLRHRVLCYAHKPYPANVDDLDVNHIDGIPGNDWLDNLEWCTRSYNMDHAYAMGLRNDNKEIQVLERETNRMLIFASCSQAGRFFNVTETTISNRAKTLGYKSFDGRQFRFHPNSEPWPVIDDDTGNFLVEFHDGSKRHCSCNEAARLAGVTRTSFLRILRENKTCRRNGVLISRMSN